MWEGCRCFVLDGKTESRCPGVSVYILYASGREVGSLGHPTSCTYPFEEAPACSAYDVVRIDRQSVQVELLQGVELEQLVIMLEIQRSCFFANVGDAYSKAG